MKLHTRVSGLIFPPRHSPLFSVEGGGPHSLLPGVCMVGVQ